MKMHKLLAVTILMVLASAIWAQSSSEPTPSPVEPAEDSEARTQASIAISNPDYPATPGDVYVLGYSYRGEPIFTLLTLSPDYQLDLGVFGTIDARDLSYLGLKQEVEEAINNRYAGSHPTFILERAGEFSVNTFLEGKGAFSLVVWGMIRLGDVIDDLDPGEDYSQRRIIISDIDGNVRNIDYYQFLYHQNMDSNPLIRPGDTINFNYSDTLVEITGEVMEPGVREIIPGDTPSEILSFFGGFRQNADKSRIQKWQFDEGREVYSLHSWEDPDLFLGAGSGRRITVHVPDFPGTRAVVYVAFNRGSPPEETSTDESDEDSTNGEYVRITVPFFEGMLVSDLYREIESELTDLADLRQCHIVRADSNEAIAIDIDKILNDPSGAENIYVEPGDILGIPSRTIFVTVSGGVYEPGRYYFTPMKTADYYVTLAGGINPEQNAHRNIEVYDQFGTLKERDSFVTPGDSILVVQDKLEFQVDSKFRSYTTGLVFLTTLVVLITAIVSMF